jgi:hypothetical protein
MIKCSVGGPPPILCLSVDLQSNIAATVGQSVKIINVREYRRGNHKWSIQRNWRHRVHKTQDEDKQKIPQYANKQT